MLCEGCLSVAYWIVRFTSNHFHPASSIVISFLKHLWIFHCSHPDNLMEALELPPKDIHIYILGESQTLSSKLRIPFIISQLSIPSNNVLYCCKVSHAYELPSYVVFLSSLVVPRECSAMLGPEQTFHKYLVT